MALLWLAAVVGCSSAQNAGTGCEKQMSAVCPNWKASVQACKACVTVGSHFLIFPPANRELLLSADASPRQDSVDMACCVT